MSGISLFDKQILSKLNDLRRINSKNPIIYSNELSSKASDVLISIIGDQNLLNNAKITSYNTSKANFYSSKGSFPDGYDVAEKWYYDCGSETNVDCKIVVGYSKDMLIDSNYLECGVSAIFTEEEMNYICAFFNDISDSYKLPDLPLTEVNEYRSINNNINSESCNYIDKKSLNVQIDTFDNFVIDILDRQNYYREKHDAPPLILDETLMMDAEEVIKKMSNKRITNKGIYRGEIIQAFYGKKPTAIQIIDSWYLEGKNYNYDKPINNISTNKFTQMIWASSKKFGIHIYTAESGVHYLCARYSPSGNIFSLFGANVKKPNLSKSKRNYISRDIESPSFNSSYNKITSFNNIPTSDESSVTPFTINSNPNLLKIENLMKIIEKNVSLNEETSLNELPNLDDVNLPKFSLNEDINNNTASNQMLQTNRKTMDVFLIKKMLSIAENSLKNNQTDFSRLSDLLLEIMNGFNKKLCDFLLTNSSDTGSFAIQTLTDCSVAILVVKSPNL